MTDPYVPPLNPLDPQGDMRERGIVPQEPRPAEPRYDLVSDIKRGWRETEDAMFMRGFQQAVKNDPQVEAEAQRIGAEIGWPAARVLNDINYAKRIAAQQEAKREALAINDPILRRQMADPEFARIAWDETRNLSVLANITGNFTAGRFEVERGELGMKAMSGSITPEEVERYYAVEAQLAALPSGDSWIGGPFRLAGQMYMTVPKAVAVGVSTAATAGILTAATPGPDEVIAVPTAFVFGLTSGMAFQAYRMEAGNAYLDYWRAGMDKGAAANAANVVGMVNALAEVAGFSALTAPAKKFVQSQIRRAVGERLHRLTWGEATRRTLRDSAGAILSEIATEDIQELSLMLGEEHARFNSRDLTNRAQDGTVGTFTSPLRGERAMTYSIDESGQITVSPELFKAVMGLDPGGKPVVLEGEGREKFIRLHDEMAPLVSAVSEGKVVERLIETAWYTLKGVWLPGTAGPALRLAGDRYRIHSAKVKHNVLAAAQEGTTQTKVVDRNAEKFTQFMASQLQGGNGERLFVTKERFHEQMKAAGVTMEQLEAEMPDVARQLRESIDVDEDVEIATSEWLGKRMFETDLGIALQEHLRIGGKNEMSFAEAKLAAAEIEKMAGEIKEQTDLTEKEREQFDVEASAIQERIRSDLAAIPQFRGEQTRVLAGLHRRVIETQAKRAKLTPAAFEEKFGRFTIIRGGDGRHYAAQLKQSPLTEGRIERIDDPARITADDDYLYHVASKNNADAILTTQRFKGATSFTEGSGVGHWVAAMGIENPVVVRIPKKLAEAAGAKLTEIADDTAAAGAASFTTGDEVLDVGELKAREFLATMDKHLLAVHNLTADNLKFADGLGGLPAPSVAVVRASVGMTQGFGEITLIGRGDLVDPAQEPVFDTDAYSPRFPELIYPKVRIDDQRKFMRPFEELEAAEFRQLRGGYTGAYEMWDALDESPRALADKMLSAAAAQLMFLREVVDANTEVPTYPTPIEGWIDGEFLEWLAPRRAELHAARLDDPFWKELSDKARETMLRTRGPELAAKFEHLHFNEKTGDLFFNQSIPIGKALENFGTRTFAWNALREQVQPHTDDFIRWIEKRIEGLFGKPSIKLKGKKVPATLENLTEAMLGNVRAREDSAKMLTLGSIRARLSRRFKSVAEMREHMDRLLDRAHDAFATMNDRLNGWWVEVLDTSSGMLDAYHDSPYRVLVELGKRKNPTVAHVKSAFARNGLVWTPGLGREAVAISAALRDAPSAFFEAKPQRSVRLSEFAGAVIPSSATREVRDILTKHGIPYLEHNGEKLDRIEKTSLLAAQLDEEQGGVLFQRAGDPFEPSPFHSAFQDALLDLKTDKPKGAAFWEQTVKGWVNNQQIPVKEEELYWIGWDLLIEEMKATGKGLSPVQLDVLLTTGQWPDGTPAPAGYVTVREWDNSKLPVLSVDQSFDSPHFSVRTKDHPDTNNVWISERTEELQGPLPGTSSDTEQAPAKVYDDAIYDAVFDGARLYGLGKHAGMPKVQGQGLKKIGWDELERIMRSGEQRPIVIPDEWTNQSGGNHKWNVFSPQLYAGIAIERVMESIRQLRGIVERSSDPRVRIYTTPEVLTVDPRKSSTAGDAPRPEVRVFEVQDLAKGTVHRRAFATKQEAQAAIEDAYPPQLEYLFEVRVGQGTRTIEIDVDSASGDTVIKTPLPNSVGSEITTLGKHPELVVDKATLQDPDKRDALQTYIEGLFKDAHRGVRVQGNRLFTHFYSHAVKGGTNYREHVFKFDTPDSNKRVGVAPTTRDHFRGSFMHIRTLDFRGTEGERVLYVNEFQSDWSRAGRDHGLRIKDAVRLDALRKAIADEEKAIESLKAKLGGQAGLVEAIDEINKDFAAVHPDELVLDRGVRARPDAGNIFRMTVPTAFGSKTAAAMVGWVDALQSSAVYVRADDLKIDDHVRVGARALASALGQPYFVVADTQSKAFTLVATADDTDAAKVVAGINAKLKGLADKKKMLKQAEDGTAQVDYAPFIESMKGWVQLAIRRVAKMAAQEGYDAVAFITGDEAHATTYGKLEGQRAFYDSFLPRAVAETLKKQKVKMRKILLPKLEVAASESRVADPRLNIRGKLVDGMNALKEGFTEVKRIALDALLEAHHGVGASDLGLGNTLVDAIWRGIYTSDITSYQFQQLANGPFVAKQFIGTEVKPMIDEIYADTFDFGDAKFDHVWLIEEEHGYPAYRLQPIDQEPPYGAKSVRMLDVSLVRAIGRLDYSLADVDYTLSREDIPDGVKQKLTEGREKVREAEAGAWTQSFAIEGTKVTADSEPLFQDPTSPRGAIDLDSMVAAIFDKGDISTFFHEAAHYYFEVLLNVFRNGGAPQQLVEDINALARWGGFGNADALAAATREERRQLHEKFAYSFESYLVDGKPRSADRDLLSALRSVRRWIVAAYKGEVFERTSEAFRAEFGTPLPALPEEIRAVMDRLVQTDEMIAFAKKVRSVSALFEIAEDAEVLQALDPETRQHLRDLVIDADYEAEEKLGAALLRQLRYVKNFRGRFLHDLQRETRDARKRIRAEVEAEVRLDPVYRLAHFLDTGEFLNSQGEPEPADGPSRLNEAGLPAKWTSKNGWPADVLAPMFDYPSGPDLLDDLRGIRPIDEVIDEKTDRRMQVEHNDLLDEEAIEQRLLEALHGPALQRLIAQSLRMFDKGLPNVRVQTAAARAVARRVIGERQVDGLRPIDYSLAAGRAQRAAQEARRAGDIPRYRAELRRALFQNALAEAAVEARDEIRKGQREVRQRFQRPVAKLAKQRKLVPVAQTGRLILSKYGLVTPSPDSIGDPNYDPLIDLDDDDPLKLDLRSQLNSELPAARPFGTLTVDELRDVFDMARGLWFRAGRERDILLDRERVALDSVLAEMEQTLDQHTKKERDVVGSLSKKEKKGRWLRGQLAKFRRMEHALRLLDRGDPAGIFTRAIWRRAKDAANGMRLDEKRYLKRLQALLDGLDLPQGTIRAQGLSISGKDFVFGNDGTSGKAQVLMALLHSGNESNLNKFVGGYKLGVFNKETQLHDTSRWWAYVQQLVNEGVITSKDLDAVQAIWNLIEETKPLAQRAHYEIAGYRFREIKAQPFTLVFPGEGERTFRGGYVPAATDREQVVDARLNSIDDLLNFQKKLPMVPKGFTMNRAALYTAQLDLDVRRLGQHLHSVMLFSHIAPALKDLRRITEHQRFKEAIDAVDPVFRDEVLRPWLEAFASQSTSPQGKDTWGWLNRFRSRASQAVMFANVKNSAQNVTGIPIVLTMVDRRYFFSALARVLGDRGAAIKRIADQSDYMADHFGDETLYDVRDRFEDLVLNRTKLEDVQAWFRKNAYWIQRLTQEPIDAAAWLGAYEQAIVEQGADVAGDVAHREAVQRADAVVRQTQLASAPEDLAAIERGSALMKVFLVFRGWFINYANLTHTNAAIRRMNGEPASSFFSLYAIGIFLPLVGAEAIDMLVDGDPVDDDEDGAVWDDLVARALRAHLSAITGAVPVYGDAVNVGLATLFDPKSWSARMPEPPLFGAIRQGLVAIRQGRLDEGRAIRSVLSMMAAVSGVPVNRLLGPAVSGYELLSGQADPAGQFGPFVEIPRALLTGRTNRQR